MADYRNPSKLPLSALKLNPNNTREAYGFVTLELAQKLTAGELTEDEKNEIKEAFEQASEEDQLVSLVRSIAQNGVREVVTAIPDNGTYWMGTGNRRLVAAHLANLILGAEIQNIPAQVRKMSEEEQLILQWEENHIRQGFTDHELYALSKKLISLGWTPKQISEKLPGLSTQKISRLSNLFDAPAPVIEAFKAGDLKTEAAIQVTRTVEELDIDEPVVAEVLTEAIAEAKAQGKSKVSGPELVNRLSKVAEPKSDTDESDETSEDDEIPDISEMIQTSIRTLQEGVVKEKDLMKVYGILSKYAVILDTVE